MLIGGRHSLELSLRERPWRSTATPAVNDGGIVVASTRALLMLGAVVGIAATFPVARVQKRHEAPPAQPIQFVPTMAPSPTRCAQVPLAWDPHLDWSIGPLC